MCGITGGIGLSSPNHLLLDTQLNTIKHRGPDGSGTFISKGIGIGMCRLAIVEIASGKQPASDSAGKIQVVWRENYTGSRTTVMFQYKFFNF